jgi:hypothetical protein
VPPPPPPEPPPEPLPPEAEATPGIKPMVRATKAASQAVGSDRLFDLLFFIVLIFLCFSGENKGCQTSARRMLSVFFYTLLSA